MNKIKYLLSVCILSFTPLFAAYSSDFEEPFIGIEENSTKTDNAWESQLNNVLRKQTRNATKKLSLIGYNYHKEIASLADLDDGLDEIFADTAHIAFQNYIDYDFEIYTIGDVKVSEYDSIRTRFDFNLLRDEIYCAFKQSIENGNKAHLIKLKWVYNGDIIYSTAIVTDDKGIIFETIGHLIVERTQKEISTDGSLTRTFPTMKKRIEGDNSNTTYQNLTMYFIVSDKIHNIFGIQLCYYSIICTSTFHSNGILKSIEASAFADAKEGFSCKADIKTISGEIDKSSYHLFAWGWGYGCGTSISLSFAGNGFSVSGTETKNTGLTTHRLD